MSETATTPVAGPQPRPPDGLRRTARAVGAWPLRPGRLLAAAGLLALTVLGTASVGVYLWGCYHFYAGRAALEHYHSTEARDHLRQCLRLWPHNPDTLLLAARAARRKGLFDEAQGYLEQYQETAGLQDDLVLEQALLRAQRGDIDGVAKFFQVRVGHNDPATPLLLEARAIGALRRFRLRDAEVSVLKWLEVQPENPQAFYLLGTLHEALDDRTGAADAYRRSVEIDPEQDAARLHLAALLLDLAQPQEALPHLDYLRQRQPDNLEVLVNLARCHDQLGDAPEAMKLLDEAIARQPRFPQALAERGRIHLRDQHLAEAEADLREATRLEPSNTVTQYQLSQVLAQDGKPQEARQVQLHIKEIEKDNARIKDIMRVEIQKDPHNPNLMCEAGQISLREGQVESALQWFDHALQEDKYHKATHEALAQYYQTIGEVGRAERHRALARQATPAAADSRPAPPASGPAAPSGRGDR